MRRITIVVSFFETICMELLLLLLLGGLTAGVGLWATLGDRKKGESTADELLPGEGPRSSPDLPQVQPGAGDLAGAGRVGEAIKLAGEADAGLQELKSVLERAPGSVEARIEKPGSKSDEKSDRQATQRQKPLKVTYSVDELIARSSRYAHHRRALSTADALIERQKAEEALSIYERVHKRVPDDDIRTRIDTNIDDIRRWQSGADVETGQLEFPEIVIPLTTQVIALENLNQGLQKISEGLVDRVSQALDIIQSPPSGGVGMPAGGIDASSGSVGGAASGAAPGGDSFRGPAAAGEPARPSPGGVPPTGSMAEGGGPIHISGPVYLAPGLGDAGPMPPGSLSGSGSGTIQAIGDLVSLKWGDGLSPGTPEELKGKDGMPPGLNLDDDGDLITDGWTDADFDKEWEKYKDLPLKDRRTGIERRKGLERRRSNDPNRKDRRTGMERRMQDLFKDREEFLNKLAKHKEHKKDLENHLKSNPEKGKDDQKPIEIPLEAILNKPEPVAEPKPAEKSHPVPAPQSEQEIDSKPVPETVTEADPAPVVAHDSQKMEMVLPDLKPIGMPSAEEPYIEPSKVSAVSGGEAMAEGGAPMTPSFSDGVEAVDDIPELGGAGGAGSEEGEDIDKPAPQEIHGVLELKPPEEDDAPFLTLTYDFTKIPDSFKLSADYHTMEFAYYKYKHMLVKAQEFTRRKMLKNALNYYRVIKSQNIPPEFKRMINRNIKDITEYLEKFLMRRG